MSRPAVCSFGGRRPMRCKVFRGANGRTLEREINAFLEDEVATEDSVFQVEEITQSEGSGGVTIVVWFSMLNEAEERDELDGKAAAAREFA